MADSGRGRGSVRGERDRIYFMRSVIFFFIVFGVVGVRFCCLKIKV